MSQLMSPSIRHRRIAAASPTPEELATFLRHLEESGSVSFAAERTGLGRNAVYDLREIDAAFARGWEEAMARAVERLRDLAIARARDGTGRAPRRRGRRMGLRVGSRAGVVRNYDNRLLMLLLGTHQPKVSARCGP